MVLESLGIRARSVASRPQRIPNAIPSMVPDGVGEDLSNAGQVFFSDALSKWKISLQHPSKFINLNI